MWTLQKDFRFEAAHKLPHHDGKCARLHGHSFVATVYVESNELVAAGPKQGMVMDYSTLKELVQPLVDELLDHHYLNDTLELENPTSEAIARWLFDTIDSKLTEAHAGVELAGVLIRETCTAACLYTRSDRSGVKL